MEKKVITIACVYNNISNFKTLFPLFYLLISYNLKAQVAPPTIMPGLAAVYSNNLEAIGVNARLYYALDHHFCFGPEVSYFKKSIENGEESLFEANVNLHYILDLKKGLGIYPLTGINYSIETEIENHNGIEEKNTETAYGLNIGAGMHYATGKVLLFGEYKYVISELEDHFFSIGALINISLTKKDKQKHH